QRIVRFHRSRAVKFLLRLFKLALVKKDQRAVVAHHHKGCRIEVHQTIVTAQRPLVFTVETMQSRLHKVDHRFARGFSSHARYFIACLLFLPRQSSTKTISMRASMIFGSMESALLNAASAFSKSSAPPRPLKTRLTWQAPRPS